MRFFDSCCERVTLADIAEDIANDLRFEEYLKKLYEERERAKVHLSKKEKEKTAYDKKTTNFLLFLPTGSIKFQEINTASLKR